MFTEEENGGLGRPVRSGTVQTARLPGQLQEAVQRGAAPEAAQRLLRHPERAVLREKPPARAASRPRNFQVSWCFVRQAELEIFFFGCIVLF